MNIDKEIEKLKLEKEVLELKLKLAEFEKEHPMPKLPTYIPYQPYYVPEYEPIRTAPVVPYYFPKVWCTSSNTSGIAK